MKTISRMLTIGLSVILIGQVSFSEPARPAAGPADAFQVSSLKPGDKEKPGSEGEKAFDDVVQNAKKFEGLFSLYRLSLIHI